MFTILGSDGKEYGPVTADQVRAWIAGGRANYETQAKAAGSDVWQRLGNYAEFGGTVGAADPSAPGSAPVPEPTLVRGPVLASTYAADLNSRSAPLDVFECLSDSFDLWKRHFFPLVTGTFLVLLAQIVSGMIPIVGLLSGLVLNGVFYGGLYYYFLGHQRGEKRELGDAFAGFTKALGPLVLATLLTSAITLAITAVFFASWIPYLLQLATQTPTDALPPLPSATVVLSSIFGGLVMLYLSVCWVFTFPLVIDHGLGPWTAMEVSRRVVGRQWFRVFGVLLFGVILALLGFIGMIVGVIFTLPLLFGAIVAAYERLCGRRR